MNTDLGLDRKWFDCSCGRADHAVRFTFDEREGDLFIACRARPDMSFLKRLQLAWRIACGDMCKYGDFCEVILDEGEFGCLREQFMRWIRVRQARTDLDRALGGLGATRETDGT